MIQDHCTFVETVLSKLWHCSCNNLTAGFPKKKKKKTRSQFCWCVCWEGGGAGCLFRNLFPKRFSRILNEVAIQMKTSARFSLNVWTDGINEKKMRVLWPCILRKTYLHNKKLIVAFHSWKLRVHTRCILWHGMNILLAGSMLLMIGTAKHWLWMDLEVACQFLPLINWRSHGVRKRDFWFLERGRVLGGLHLATTSTIESVAKIMCGYVPLFFRITFHQMQVESGYHSLHIILH